MSLSETVNAEFALCERYTTEYHGILLPVIKVPTEKDRARVGLLNAMAALAGQDDATAAEELADLWRTFDRKDKLVLDLWKKDKTAKPSPMFTDDDLKLDLKGWVAKDIEVSEGLKATFTKAYDNYFHNIEETRVTWEINDVMDRAFVALAELAAKEDGAHLAAIRTALTELRAQKEDPRYVFVVRTPRLAA